MKNLMESRDSRNRISRRDFLRIMGISSVGILAGCAVNPVTGKSQLMLVSEENEIAIDRQYSPKQFSSDYGVLQDKGLNQYLGKVGKGLAKQTHRPNMPYSFQGVNAVYINAYAFPGGSIACTRGILLAIENEAELAALLGHELGHVNARHTARQMSKGQLASIILGGAAAIAGAEDESLGRLISGIGSIGAGALLAKYSRDNEREADSLGLEYIVKAQYNPEGMAGLQDMLRNMSRAEPNLLELMFSTHPMSRERYQTAVKEISGQYGYAGGYRYYRERYMDHTAGLRSKRRAVEELQKAEKLMAGKEYSKAENHINKALKSSPNDYTGLMMMAKCKVAKKKYREANRYARLAKETYPKEPQAHFILGQTDLMSKKFNRAIKEFTRYDNLLPGNPDIHFLKGLSFEGMGRKKNAAQEYYRYLQIVNQGEAARHAYKSLVNWGYVKK